WFSTPQYGYVWQPVVVRDVSWRPYTRGRWVCTDHGWTWVSDEPFGWATYHYGRWALVAGRGWVWIPGSEWAPAWVCWRYGSSHIGWAPLPPESLAYRHWAWDANIEATLGIGSSWFCFVETRNFCEPVRRHCLPYSRHRDFWNHTRNVTRFQHVRGRTICGGPSYGDVSRQTARPIPFYRLETDRDGRIVDRHPRVSQGKLRMHAPNVDVAWNAGLRPKNLRGTWSDVAIQRDRQPEADVRKRFEETRVKDRQRAEQTIQWLGGPEKFPAKRREELTANREKRNPERQTSGRETQRRETPPVAATERRRTTGPSEETKKPTRVETPRKKDESETRKERNVSSNDRDTRKPQLPPGMVESRQESRGPTRPVAPRDPGQRKHTNGRRTEVAPDVFPTPRRPDPSGAANESKRRDQARQELEEKMKQSAARERDRQQRLDEARRQQAETARRETARRDQEVRQRELMQRAEEQRQRNDRVQREAEQNRRQQDADRREQAARQQAREESQRRQQDDMRRQQEQASRQREEQASRQREAEQQARRQQEESSRRQQEEASRRQQEESSRRQQAEERQRQEQRRDEQRREEQRRDEQNRNRRNR
ncbi:MAG: hypothetical protein KDN05_18780, partial [Verrucomicrobiae bacterium]|nr:hypothetical protein [Verrucomicrobiae bacterium]